MGLEMSQAHFQTDRCYDPPKIWKSCKNLKYSSFSYYGIRDEIFFKNEIQEKIVFIYYSDKLVWTKWHWVDPKAWMLLSAS